MLIRKESPADIPAIHKVIHDAFGKEGEAQLVDDLRASGNLAISLVAAEEDTILGHIAFSPMSIDDTVGLAPLAVAPEFQRHGIGGALMLMGIGAVRARRLKAVFVLGSDKYYPRFGFVPAKTFGIKCVYPDTNSHFFAMELEPGFLTGKEGTIHYAPEFGKL